MSLTGSGFHVPWATPGGTSCCCDGGYCGFIPRSVCGQANMVCISGPGPTYYPEFTDPASCPPKYYRTKTTRREESWTYSNTTGGVPPTTYTGHGNLIWTTIETVGFNEETEECDFAKDCTGTFTGATSHNSGGGNSQDYDYTTVECDDLPYGSCWSGTLTWQSGDVISYDCADWDVGGIYLEGSNGFGDIPLLHGASGDWTVNSPTEREVEEDLSVSEGSEYTGFSKRTETLSDEVTIDEMIDTCSVVPCVEGDPPDEFSEACTTFCCTDRGSPREGLAYRTPLIPEGCAKGGRSPMAYLVCGSAAGTRVGQGSKITLWVKDLTPGTSYRMTLVYKRCSFQLDGMGEYIQPAACDPGPCYEINSDDYREVTDHVDFVAEHWAEVYGECEQCAVMLKICELEDEANDWNIDNPGPDRTVGCGGTPFNVPTHSNTYTWAHSCELTELPPPE